MSGRVAIIPARGGSRRIPRKNVREFLGRPAIEYPIEAAQRCGLFDEIIVSTDDDEIAERSRAAGASVPFRRPAALAGEQASTASVLRHALEWLEATAPAPDTLCCLYPTAVFTTAADLAAAFALLQRSGAQMVFAAQPYPHPVQRALVEHQDGRMRALCSGRFEARTQTLKPAYHDAGQFYWLRAGMLRSAASAWDDALAYKLPRHRAQDLDEPEDWAHAEALYRLLQEPST